MKISAVTLFIMLILFSGYLTSQDYHTPEFTYIQIDSTKQMWGDWNEPDWLRYFGLDAGDVDRDGNLDVISGRYIYHNPGGSMQDEWKRTVLDDNVDAILSMDVDGDPFADIIAMALPHLYWYEAIDLEGTKYQRTLIGNVPATSHVNSQGFEKAQIIEGGHSEFVIAGDGDIYAVEIPEQNPSEVPWKIKLICEDTSDEGIGVGDIDGDGDLDIAAGRRPEGEGEPTILVWFENPGSIDVLWQPTVIGHSEHPIDRVEVADVNNDEKADVIVTEERYPGLEPDAHIWWFEQATSNGWKRNEITQQYSTNNLDITDFDRDGDVDLLTAEHKGKALELQLWKNDSKGNFKKTVLDMGKENHLGTQWVDLDNDGDLDIIGAGWDNHRFMHVWRNDAIKPLETGMFFKDHSWVPTMVSDEGKFLRVGGKLDYKINEEHLSKKYHKDGFIPLKQAFDLENAIRAEVFVERVQSHEDTKNLKIQFNDGNAISLREPSTIKESATDYMFHFNSRARVPLADLVEGNTNTFKLTVDPSQKWDWPQNLIYGLVIRIFYNVEKVERQTATINGVIDGEKLKTPVALSIKNNGQKNIAKVDYIGFYEDVNVQGDGKYLQWQYRVHRGEFKNHIGTAIAPPFEVKWNTDWIPDQKSPISILALVTNNEGRTYATPKIKNLQLSRNHSVKLLKPYGQPPFWTTRGGAHTEHFHISNKPDKKAHAKLFWNSWSPCYSEGLNINGTKQPPKNNLPCYDAHWHEESLTDINILLKGENRLTTLKTPLYEGQMVHGMDVQWPGIILKVKGPSREVSNVTVTQTEYEKRPHFLVHSQSVTYYYDIAGGGFSRIIDQYGNDWVSYKNEPWNEYPVSAASSFRGLPNLVFGSETDGGAGHPGHDKCISKIVGENTILTTSKSGNWQWKWTFHEDHAILEMLKTGEDTPYWFLYEGTQGGTFNPETSYYGTNMSGPNFDAPDFFSNGTEWGDYQWAYFGKQELKSSFFAAQVAQDNQTDMMSYLGNSEKGMQSKDGMTVFGFGRGQNTAPLLTGQNTFIIGFYNDEIATTAEHLQIKKHITNLIKKQH